MSVMSFDKRNVEDVANDISCSFISSTTDKRQRHMVEISLSLPERCSYYLRPIVHIWNEKLL